MKKNRVLQPTRAHIAKLRLVCISLSLPGRPKSNIGRTSCARVHTDSVFSSALWRRRVDSNFRTSAATALRCRAFSSHRENANASSKCFLTDVGLNSRENSRKCGSKFSPIIHDEVGNSFSTARNRFQKSESANHSTSSSANAVRSLISGPVSENRVPIYSGSLPNPERSSASV